MSPRRHIPATVLLVVCIAILVAEGVLAPRMFPINDGTPDEFWRNAVGLDTTGTLPLSAGFYVGTDGTYCTWAIYGYHNVTLYRTPIAAANAAFPLVRAGLVGRAADPSLNRDRNEAFRRWSLLPAASRTPAELLTIVDKVIDDRLAREAPDTLTFIRSARASAHAVVEKSHRYWATFLFDTLLFWLLCAVALFPFFHPYRFFRYIICWGTLPLLFFLPTFLGYATYSRTPWGPSGGILYPWPLFFSGTTSGTDTEFFLLAALPRPLAHISQDPDGPIFALTGSGLRGPALLLLYTLAALTVTTLYHFIRNTSLRRPPQPAFEVLTQNEPKNKT